MCSSLISSWSSRSNSLICWNSTSSWSEEDKWKLKKLAYLGGTLIEILIVCLVCLLVTVHPYIIPTNTYIKNVADKANNVIVIAIRFLYDNWLNKGISTCTPDNWAIKESNSRYMLPSLSLSPCLPLLNHFSSNYGRDSRGTRGWRRMDG